MFATPPIDRFFRSLTQQSDVLLLGDTQHSDPAIKGTAAALIPTLKQEGVNSLWLEIDRTYQPAFEQFVTAHPMASARDLSQFMFETTRLKSSPSYGELLKQALSQGLVIRFIDDKRPADAVRAAFPEYEPIRRQVKAHTAAGGLEGRETYLRTLRPDMRAHYEAGYSAWKAARDEINPSIADAIAQHQQFTKGKALVVIGNEHMNSAQDLDELLEQTGLRVGHVDIYRNQQSCLNDIRRITAESGTATAVPPFAYFVDEQRVHNASQVKKHLLEQDAKIPDTKTPNARISAPTLTATLRGLGRAFADTPAIS